ncbi:MAG: MarR family transcriptional regulator [Gemmatimonadetes bacterium]|nr:MarR family transcriptional regulator [Gemmatimonadota bacterium]
MANEDKLALLQRLMGASQVYCSTMSSLLERMLEEASDTQLALSQLKLLMLISPSQYRLKVTDVADFLDVSNAAASRAIDRLVQRGLVHRAIAPDNRRAVDLSLTNEGKELIRHFQELRDREVTRLLGDYPADKLRTMARLLDEASVLMLDLDEAAEQQCLRCDVHFRRGCVLREVLGRDCETRTALFETPRDAER